MGLLDKLPSFIAALSVNYPWAIYLGAGLGAIGSLTIVASGIIKLTPSKKDDAWLESIESGSVSGKLLNVLRLFSVVRLKSDNAAAPVEDETKKE